MKHAVSLIFSLIVTAALLTYALWGVDLNALWAILLNGAVWTIPPFLFLLGLFFFSNALRWALVLKPFGRYRAMQVAPAMMIGFAGNNLLPLRLGEVVRTLIFAQESGQSRSGILMTLVVERALDLVGILAIFAGGVLLLGEVPTGLRIALWLALLAVGSLILLLALFARHADPICGWWERIAIRLPAALTERGAVYLREFARALSVFGSPRDALLVLLHSLLRWGITAGMVWLCVRAYGVALTPGLAMLVVGVTALAVSLPSVPGFVGPIQAGFVAALTPFGVPQDIALAGSILFLVGHWLPVTLVGGFFFVRGHYSYRKVRREALAMQDG